MGGGQMAHDRLGIMVSQLNESGPFMQLNRGTIRTQTKSTELKSLWTILASLTSNYMADLESPLPQDLPKEAHLANRGNHGTLGSPQPLPSWVI